MSFLDTAISLIAPHKCVVCGNFGELLCSACAISSLPPLPSRCYRCHKVSRQFSVCNSCRATVKINHVWVASPYELQAKEIIYRLKFERAKSAGGLIAEILNDVLPDLPPDLVICHIPTANNRVRLRGYDQSSLIAKKLAKLRRFKHESLLIRTGTSRQVGAGRKERFKHLERALKINPKIKKAPMHVLLVDDVTTTGATIEAAAKVLKTAGVKTVDVAVFAQA